MRIDDHVEGLARSALDAAVHKDPTRFQRALGAFRDENTAVSAVELVLAVIASVLFEVHDGLPSREQVRDLAGDIAQQESWVELRSSDVESLLVGVTFGEQERLSSLADNASLVAFVVAANLLATASQPDEGEWWFNYLDKVEAAIEAAG